MSSLVMYVEMARLSLSTKRKLQVTINALFVYLRMLFVVCAANFASVSIAVRKPRRPIPPLVLRVYKQVEYLFALVYESDVVCIHQL